MTKKKPKKVSTLLPVTRSVRRLRELGWIADIAERKIGLFSKDWGGFADIVAITAQDSVSGPMVLLVQATGWGNVADRKRKVLACPEAYECCYAGCRIEIWGWSKDKADPKIIVLDDLSAFDPSPVA